MCVEVEYLDHIANTVHPEVNFPYVCLLVDKTNISNRIQKRLFYANESHIYFFEQKSFTKSLMQVYSNTYFDLLSINMPDNETLTLKFNNNNDVVTLKHKLVKEITAILLVHIHNTLINREMPEVDLFDFDYTIITHSYLAFYNRFRAICFRNDITPSKSILNKIYKFCVSCPKECDLLELDIEGKYSYFLLQCLQIEPRITTLIVQTPTLGIMWNKVADFIASNTTIVNLFSYENLNQSFALVPEAFKKNKRTKIQKFILMRATCYPAYLQVISEILASHKLDVFGIAYSLNGDTAIRFMKEFGSNIAFGNLSSLCLDGTDGLDISQLLRSTQNVKSLSLENCGIELCLFFGYLSLEKNFIISDLNLSGNKATKLIKDSLKLPDSLKTISVANTVFKDDNLLRLLKLLTQKKLNIDVSRAIMDETKWNQFFDNIDTLSSDSILSLNWNENAVYLEFFDFLDNANSLTSLKMDGCFSQGDMMLPEASKYIEDNVTLKELSIRGTSRRVLSDSDIPVLFKGLLINRSIVKLDIGGNNLTSESLDPISNMLLTNRKIETLIIDTPKIFTIDFLIRFYTELSRRGTPLSIDWPESDIIFLQENANITDSTIASIKDLYDIITRGDPTMKIPIFALDREKAPEPHRPRVTRNRNLTHSSQSEEYLFPPLDLKSFISQLDSRSKEVGVLRTECKTAPPPVEPTDYDVAQKNVPNPTTEDIKNDLRNKYSAKTLFNRIEKTL